MQLRKLLICLMLDVYSRGVTCNDYDLYQQKPEVKADKAPKSPEPKTPDSSCSPDDYTCLGYSASDKLALEDINKIHNLLDDDKNGNIDYSESDDFLREELKYNSGYEKRQKVFHRNDDMQISVKDLYEAWLKSEVHNWTLQQTTDWLVTSVELPQYVPNFQEYQVTGARLPRLAVNTNNYLGYLGIKDPIHRQKISLKAMDVVLFGPPKDGPHWKDLTLILLTILGAMGLWYAFQQNKKFKDHLTRMNQDMDSLQNAEKALENLQKELEQAKQAQETVITEKINLEKKLQDSDHSLPNSYSDLEVSQLKAEIELLRTELQLAEGELKDRCWSPPPGLQHWLQLTHEIENKSYIKNKLMAEKQLQQAREACEKLRKKRSSLVGAFVSTHGKSIDEVDRSIVEARTALNEVTHELQERVHRWKQIEMLCGFNIINNNGLQYLENTLYRGGSNKTLSIKGRMNSQDDLDDETASLYSTVVPGYPGHPVETHWGRADGDSSGSEGSRLGEESKSNDTRTNHHSVAFSVGSEVSPWGEDSATGSEAIIASRLGNNPKSYSNSEISLPKVSPMIRSFSQETNIRADSKPKFLSEANLDASVKGKVIRPLVKKEPTPIEEDVCSTDSSVFDEDIKKKKRKLFSFTKKKSHKSD